MRTCSAALLLVFFGAVQPAHAQSVVTAPGRFAIDVSGGGVIVSGGEDPPKGTTLAFGGEVTLAPTWFLRGQYGAGTLDRVLVGVAHSFARLRARPRAFMSGEAGFASVNVGTWKPGVYAGVSLQVPIGEGGLAFNTSVKAFVLEERFGGSFTAGLKLHF